jgi:hypothetical protein
MKSFFTTE